MRSQKPTLKRVEVKKEISPDRLAFLKYLGNLDEEEGEVGGAQGNNKWIRK